MTEIMEVRCQPLSDGVWTPAEWMEALQTAAKAHANELDIGHDRMLEEFGCLWMLVRCRVEWSVLPEPTLPLTVRTWLRKPSPILSVRDHDLLQDGRILGRAVQDWVLVDTATRKLAGMKNIPILWELPCPQPQRTESIRRLRMPDVLPCEAQTIIATEEIDDNGHLNNVAYIRHAQRFAAPDCTGLEVSFDRECFAGEALTLHAGDGFVRGDKADGSESFRLHFYRAEEK